MKPIPFTTPDGRRCLLTKVSIGPSAHTPQTIYPFVTLDELGLRIEWTSNGVATEMPALEWVEL